MRYTTYCLTLLIAMAACCTGTADAAIVMINSNSVRTLVGEPDSSGDFDTFGGTSIPLSHLLQSFGTAPLEEYAKVQIDYSAAAGVTTFDHQFSLGRQGLLNSVSQSYDTIFCFTPDSNTTYDASGYMLVDDIGEGSGRVFYHTSLFNVTANSLVYEFENQSVSSTDESFTLGTHGGDLYNYQFGSLTGSLVGGNRYKWVTNAYIKAAPDADSGATATGLFRLEIGATPIAAVPEPSSLLTLTGLALSFGAGNWWRRRRTKMAA